jgi:hypothetical protein
MSYSGHSAIKRRFHDHINECRTLLVNSTWRCCATNYDKYVSNGYAKEYL